MKEVKTKICIVCQNEFKPFKTTQKVCGIKCSLIHAKEKTKQKEVKSWNKEKKYRKEKLKTYSDWLKYLQIVFNTYIRDRDKKDPCISCGTTRQNIKYDAGHFFSVGAFPNVRFDEDNVHRQCSNNCNVKLSGNIHEYRPRLIKKIGVERFEALELRARKTDLKLSIPEIKEKIEYYKQKTKLLKQ